MNLSTSFRIFIVVATLLLGACASLSEKQCRGQDWNGIGYRDGLNGRSEFRVNDHQKACAKYGIDIDLKTYEAGRQRGLDRYCTIDNGLRNGRDGNSYEGVCPPEAEPAFLRAYRLGLEINRVDSRLTALRNERSSIFNRLREMSEEKHDDADDDHRDEEDRKHERERAKERAHERETLNYRLIEIEREELRLEQDYRDLEIEARQLH
ncbi:MAG TPA: DUF2799 domain-containing protein [Steroidobacteraceae bacterium]|nr:DUF2799 domain-containing protein [Steroidobacteraceae bacterium]